MTTLILIRHGQTDWNVEGRWQGQADPPLNERGRGQAYLVSLELELAQQKMTTLYSSDLRRAMETAQIIGTALELQVVPDPRLREINLGLWQGMLSTDIRQEYTRAFHSWYASPQDVCPPGGEGLGSLASRVLQVTNEIMQQHPGETVGIVAHEFPIAVILCRAVNMDLGHLREMIPQTGSWRILKCEKELR